LSRRLKRWQQTMSYCKGSQNQNAPTGPGRSTSQQNPNWSAERPGSKRAKSSSANSNIRNGKEPNHG